MSPAKGSCVDTQMMASAAHSVVGSLVKTKLEASRISDPRASSIRQFLFVSDLKGELSKDLGKHLGATSLESRSRLIKIVRSQFI